MRAPRLMPLLSLAVLAAGLTGCTVGIVDPSEPSQKAPTQEQTSQAPDAEEEAPEAETPATSGLSADGQEERDRLIAAATTTMPCPDGPLTADGAIVRVEGACPELVIEIDAGVVIADDVDEFTLEGSGTIVYAENLGVVTVTGSASSIFWSGATPTVHDSGSSNTLRKG